MIAGANKKSIESAIPCISSSHSAQTIVNPSNSTNSEADMSWIYKQLNPMNQNEQSLQQKIIQLYQIIEKKTIRNIESKKNNQILKAQVDAYQSIIEKIQKAQQKGSQYKIQSQQDQKMQQSTLRKTTFDTEEKQDEGKTFDEVLAENRRHVVDQTFQMDHFDKTSLTNRVDVDLNRKTEGMLSSVKQSKPIKRKNQEISRSSRDIRSLRTSDKMEWNQNENNKQLQEFRLQLKKNQNKQKFVFNFIDSYKLSNNSSINLACSPRPSIDTNLKKSVTNNKSFLKRVASNTNLVNCQTNRYKSVDIEALWNQAKSPVSSDSKGKLIKDGHKQNNYFKDSYRHQNI